MATLSISIDGHLHSVEFHDIKVFELKSIVVNSLFSNFEILSIIDVYSGLVCNFWSTYLIITRIVGAIQLIKSTSIFLNLRLLLIKYSWHGLRFISPKKDEFTFFKIMKCLLRSRNHSTLLEVDYTYYSSWKLISDFLFFCVNITAVPLWLHTLRTVAKFCENYHFLTSSRREARLDEKMGCNYYTPERHKRRLSGIHHLQ